LRTLEFGVVLISVDANTELALAASNSVEYGLWAIALCGGGSLEFIAGLQLVRIEFAGWG